MLEMYMGNKEFDLSDLGFLYTRLKPLRPFSSQKLLISYLQNDPDFYKSLGLVNVNYSFLTPASE